MADLNDDSLKKLLGDDPIATSVSVRIRQDEQTLANLERRFNSIKKEAEGIVKALKEAGVHANNLGGIGGGKSGKASSTIGSTRVAGATFTPTPIDRGRGTVTGMAPGGQTSTSGGGGGNFFTRAYQAVQPGPGGQPTEGSVRMATGMETLNAVLNSSDARINRGYAYSLPADRMNMLYQQMKGMSQQAVQDTYRQPLAGRMLGQGGINAMLALEASTGISAAQQARSVEALRISSGFSVNAQQAASTLEQLASPQVANRMFMMTGMSLVKPGGGHRSLDEVMRHLVKTQGLTDPRILQGAKAQGSVTRNNLSNIGITGELQTQLIQYAEQNLAYKQKGGTGMYDPTNREHQKTMGIDKNFAMEKERTTQLEIEREEKFYSRQADNFGDLERQTQSLVRVLSALEDKLSGVFGLRISTQVGAKAGQSIGSAFLGPVGGAIGKFVGTIGGLGDAPGFKTADRFGRESQRKLTPSKITADQAERESQRKLTPSQTAAVSSRRSAVTTSGLGPGRTTADMAERRAINFSSGSSGSNLAAPLTDAKMSPRDTRFKNTPIYGPDGKVTNLYDLMTNPRVSGQLPEFNAGWMDLYADYYAQYKDVGSLSGAIRTFQEQENMWHERMRPTGVTEKGNIPPGSRNDWFYEGQYWEKKNESYADVAWPGAPWANHQHGLAVDLSVRNKDAWADFNRKNASSYGIEWFGDVNNEPWHLQMAGTRVRGSGGGAGYAARAGFATPDLNAPVTASDLQERRRDLGLYGSRRDLSRGLGGPEFRGLPPDVAERRIAASRELMGKLSSGSPTPPTGVAGKTISSGAYVSGKPLSIDQLTTLYYNTGFRDEALSTMVAITMRESGGDPTAINPRNELSLGLGQHNMDPNTTSASQNRIDWGLSSNDDLFDPVKNAWVSFEKYKYNIHHGMDPFHQWGPYKGVPALHGRALDYVDAAKASATKLYGSINQLGDGLPPEKRPAYKPEPRMITNTTGTPMAGSAVGLSTPVLQGGNTITVAPTINITASGGNLDQDLEKMARKVAMMLEREVNRTMMRRT